MASKIGIKAHRAKPLKGGQRASSTAEVKSADHLYLQVARTLKEEIVGGVYPVGSQLPTEDDLCERFSISRYTVREALHTKCLMGKSPRLPSILIRIPFSSLDDDATGKGLELGQTPQSEAL